MSENERVQYKFMIPSRLKMRLEDAAHENRRSLSAEIIERLEASLLDTAASKTADIKIALDTDGMPISVQEVMVHLHALTSHLKLDTISIEIDASRHSDDRSKHQQDNDLIRILGKYHVMRNISDDTPTKADK